MKKIIALIITLTSAQAFAQDTILNNLAIVTESTNTGSGSGFPLTEDGDLAGHSLTNGFFAGDGSGLTNLTGSIDTKDSAKDQAYLMYDSSSNGYVHQYGPRSVWGTADFSDAQAASNTIYPGQLYRFEFNDSVYICTNEISAPPFTSTNYPTPLNTGYWKLFVQDGTDGTDGSDGAKGDTGSPGVGQIYYGPWDNTRSYVYDTNHLWVVSRGGQWYDIINSSTNKDPLLGDTNYWDASIWKGADGTVTVISNIVDRGVWSAVASYTTNDMVRYDGNTFYVGPTNQQPSTGVAPPVNGNSQGYNNAYWVCASARGDKGDTGATGAAGEDGAVTTNILNITYNVLLDTNQYEWINSATTNDRIPVFKQTENGTNKYEWISDSELDVGGGYFEWSTNDATSTVNMDNNSITNISQLQVNDSISYSNLASITYAGPSINDAGGTLYLNNTGGDSIQISCSTDSDILHIYDDIRIYGNLNVGNNGITNAMYYGDGSGLTNLPAMGEATNATLVNGVSGSLNIQQSSNTVVWIDGTNLYIAAAGTGGGGGETTKDLNGASALDWAIDAGSQFERWTTNGLSVLKGDYDYYRTTGYLLLPWGGGTIVTNYITGWGDVAVTNDVIQQVYTNNGSGWFIYTAVTDSVPFTTSLGAYGLSSVTWPDVTKSALRLAFETNELSSTLYIESAQPRAEQ